MLLFINLFRFFFIPRLFLAQAPTVLRWLYITAFSIVAMSLYICLLHTPRDITQGEVFRILYIHVPMAVYSLILYFFLALCTLLARGAGFKMAEHYALALGFVGTLTTLLALLTGIIWAKPTWGAWWVWDARLTSELILLLLYLGYLSCRLYIQPIHISRDLSAWIAFLGCLDLPLVHYSVNWWYTLHQGATVLHLTAPKMPWVMLYPLLIAFLGYAVLLGAMTLHTAWLILCMRDSAHRIIR